MAMMGFNCICGNTGEVVSVYMTLVDVEKVTIPTLDAGRANYSIETFLCCSSSALS